MLARFLRDERGNIAIISTLMLSSLVGVSGLVAEFGNGLLNRMQDQRIADAAALAGGTIYSNTASSVSMIGAANRIATLSGLPSGSVASTLVSSPTGDGNQAVKVIVNTSVPLALSRVLYGQDNLPVTVTSYAELKTGAGSGSGCVLALSPTANNAITISGSANVQSPNCDVIANSDSSSALDMSGSAKLTTPCTITVGGQQTTSGLTLNSCTRPTTGASATPDPYASLVAPTSMVLQTCLTVPNPATNIPPGYYCHGISINGPASFQAGTYYVKGNLALQGSSNVTGTGVTFFIDKSGTTAISGSAVVNLSAATTGTYAGVLFFGDRAGTTSNNNNISGGTNSVLTGAIYYPTQEVTYSGGTSANSSCTQVIGDVITFSGSAAFGSNCTGTGVATIVPPGTTKYAALVQ